MISTISICEPIQCSVPDIYVNFKYPDDSILSMISTPAVCQSINVIIDNGLMIIGPKVIYRYKYRRCFRGLI